MEGHKEDTRGERKHRSGASHKYVPGRHSYHKTSLLLKEVKNSTSQDDQQNLRQIIDTDVPDNLVPYSLNKKGRWRLPEQLQQHIIEGEGEGQENASIYEYHKILLDAATRNASCIQYTTPKDKCVTPKTSKYININSVHGKPNRGRRRNRRRRSAQQALEQEQQAPPEVPKPSVVYRVLYPAPMDSNMTQTPKFIDTGLDFSRGKHHHNKTIHNTFDKLDLQDAYNDDPDNDDDIDEDDDSSPSAHSADSPDSSIDLDEYDLLEEFSLKDERNQLEILLDRALKAEELCKDIRRAERLKHASGETSSEVCGEDTEGALPEGEGPDAVLGDLAKTSGWEIADTKKEKGYSFYSDDVEAEDFVKINDGSSLHISMSKAQRKGTKGPIPPVSPGTDEEKRYLTDEERIRYRYPSEKKGLIRERKLEEANDPAFAECLKHTENSLMIPEGDLTTLPNPKFTRSIPVAIIFNKDELTPENLQQRYATRYTEAKTCVRRFVVDMTDSVMGHVNEGRRGDGRVGDMWALLVCVFSGEYDDQRDVYNVYLNSELNMHSLRIETLFDMMACTLEEVESAILYYMDTLPAYCYPPYIQPSIAGSSALTFDTLTSLHNWGTTTYNSNLGGRSLFTPNDTSTNPTTDDSLEPSQNSSTSQEPSTSHSALQSDDLDPSPTSPTLPDDSDFPAFCSVCYALIEEGDFESSPSNALAACRHWFCDECWRSHLCEKIDGGSLKPLTCPEYKCDSPIDHATVLSLIPASVYRIYIQRCHDNTVQRSSDTVWCPNPKCGRVVKIDSATDNACVVCECGFNFCLQCRDLSHWPASCGDAHVYYDKRAKLGDDALVNRDYRTKNSTITVHIKNCPRCHEPIQKFGGCSHMVCRCGHQFCWNCMRDYPEATPCTVVAGHGSMDVLGTRSVTFSEEDRLAMLSRKGRSPLYIQALRHCRERNYGRMHEFRKQRFILSSNIKGSLYNHERACHEISAEFGLSLTHTNRQDINQAVDDLVDKCVAISGENTPSSYKIYRYTTEIHFIIEHTCVMIDGMTRRSPWGIGELLKRMEFVVGRIHQIFEAGGTRLQSKTFTRLFHLKSHAKRCIVQLIKILANIKQ